MTLPRRPRRRATNTALRRRVRLVRDSCGTCNYADLVLPSFDLDGSESISLSEFNVLMTEFGLARSTNNTWKSTVQKICESQAIDSEDCGGHLPEMRLTIFENNDGGFAAEVRLGAADWLAHTPVSSFPYLPEHQHHIVQSLAASNLAVTHEDIIEVFSECLVHADCDGQLATACGNVDAEFNDICSRKFAVPLYCSPTCRTGGCGPLGDALPNAPGPFCQPCDACVLESSSSYPDGVNPCPSWCEGFNVTETGTFAKEHDTLVASVNERPAKDLKTHLLGEFTLMAWVRDFRTQWMFEKYVHLPGLNAHEGYDNATEMLACWQMGATEVRYRNRWDEKEMTVIQNPLSHLVTGSDSWHFVALSKVSYSKNSMRFDTL
eukprot:CAMPEP_0115530226 /NCGR_PEP_ID=MMETSP0271-20121206/84380_1 /TAXON_ID=71861 /ORGANISM="Scrippsiella trochoidea, Strain CCMP3099" /LENGTH=377 /DNA_ID=CAMNT_0002962337 /DNA_START=141 /DNA_END=1270 /DNA_ORIENTATION=+